MAVSDQRSAVSSQRSAVRKIDHKLTVYGTEDNCLKRDLQDLWDLQDWELGVGNRSSLLPLGIGVRNPSHKEKPLPQRETPPTKRNPSHKEIYPFCIRFRDFAF